VGSFCSQLKNPLALTLAQVGGPQLEGWVQAGPPDLQRPVVLSQVALLTTLRVVLHFPVALSQAGSVCSQLVAVPTLNSIQLALPQLASLVHFGRALQRPVVLSQVALLTTEFFLEQTPLVQVGVVCSQLVPPKVRQLGLPQSPFWAHFGVALQVPLV
jgi:hypothetical protein